MKSRRRKKPRAGGWSSDDPDKRGRSLQNLERGHELNLRHGGFAFLRTHTLQCGTSCLLWKTGRCGERDDEGEECGVLSRMRAESEAAFANMSHLCELDTPLVQLWQLAAEEVWMTSTVLREVGMVRDGKGGVSVARLHRVYASARRDLERISKELCLSPLQRSRLVTGMVAASSWASRVWSDKPKQPEAEVREVKVQ